MDNQSFWLDIKIILITILKVLKREGINLAGQATASEFNPQIKWALVIVSASTMSFRHASPIETFEDKLSRNLCSDIAHNWIPDRSIRE